MSDGWVHQSSPAWLRARQGYLTASQIEALWPVTKTGRKRSIQVEDYVAEYLKSSAVDTLASRSYGAAARGHILEPYAIEEFQLQSEKPIYHWDDCLITGDTMIAFSPDALDIEQKTTDPLVSVNNLATIREVTEIKSYGIDKHYETRRLGKFASEKIQIAAQMYVCKDAELGRLILYNPRLTKGCLFYTEWSRAELADELEIISEIHDQYVHISESKWILDGLPERKGASEEEIIAAQQLLWC